LAAIARTLDPLWSLTLPVLLLAHLAARARVWERATARLPDWGFAIAFGALVALVLPCLATEHRPFIYFQF
jgi:hypothetical protein